MSIQRAFIIQIPVNLCGRHQSVTVLVYRHIYYIRRACNHALFLLAERAEKVFHQSPVEKRTVFVYPGHFEMRKFSHLGQWLLGGCYEALVLVEIDEYVYFVACFGAFRYITCRQ